MENYYLSTYGSKPLSELPFSNETINLFTKKGIITIQDAYKSFISSDPIYYWGIDKNDENLCFFLEMIIRDYLSADFYQKQYSMGLLFLSIEDCYISDKVKLCLFDQNYTVVGQLLIFDEKQ